MGQQQLLLIILGVIIVGIAIAVGLSLFSAQSIQANKDAMINDINNIAAYCYQYRIRPVSMGGGGQNYLATMTVPSKMLTNDNGTYTAVGNGTTTVAIGGKSASNTTDGTISVSLDSDGKLSGWTYGTYFQ
jgi:hypothetical protein